MKLYKHFKNKKVLITGHTGFKGSWLTIWLLKMGAKVYGISDRIPTQPSMFEHLDLQNKINHRIIDIQHYQQLESAIRDTEPDYVFHLAAQAIVSESYADPLNTLSTNIMGTAHILEALKSLEKQCVAVFITSDKCYENVEQVWGYKETDHLGGKDIYSASKGSAEVVFHAYFHSFFRGAKTNIRLSTARAGNVIGGGDFSKDRLIPDCMRAWSNNQKVTIRNPFSTRPWQHVLEPLSGYLHLAGALKDNKDLNGESFNFGPKNELNISVADIIGTLGKYWGFNDPQQAFDYVKSEHFNEAGLLKLNCDKALHYLKWEANLGNQDTLKKVSEWYRRFYSNSEDMFSFSLSQISDYEQHAVEKGLVWAESD